MDINVRTEKESDVDTIRKVTKIAFMGAQKSDGDEHNLVSRVRKSESFVPELSLVAESGGKVIGHVLFSKVKIKGNDEECEALVLAPVSVLPEFQRQGAGSAMIKEGLAKAKKLKHSAVFVLGSPKYYERFGFKKAKPLGFSTPFGDMDAYFMMIELQSGAMSGKSGEIVYPKEFFKEK